MKIAVYSMRSDERPYFEQIKTPLIESEKIGALGLDVVEGEEGITHVDHRIDIISNQKMAYLRQFRNVVMTQHMAFYTEEAVEKMVQKHS